MRTTILPIGAINASLTITASSFAQSRQRTEHPSEPSRPRAGGTPITNDSASPTNAIPGGIGGYYINR